jgi:hypothetical protein
MLSLSLSPSLPPVVMLSISVSLETTLHHCVIRSQNFEATLQEAVGLYLFTVVEKDSKLPQNFESDYPLSNITGQKTGNLIQKQL